MNVNNAQISDKTFLAKFEDLTLNECHFDHIGHLRLSWLYLNKYTLGVAIRKASSGIAAYATSLGGPDKFHITITDAMMRLVASRFNQNKQDNWRDFLEANADLVEGAIPLLREYYSHELLFSEDARTSLVPPDIQNI